MSASESKGIQGFYDELKALFQQADKSGEGKLALPEFKAAVKGSSSGSQLNDMQLEAMFNFYDEDKTGFVSFESVWKKMNNDSRNYNIYWRRLGYEPLRHCEPSPETFISMVIRLRKHNGVDWVNDGQVTSTFCTEGLGYDFNEVLLPFCRLSRVRRFRVIPDTEEMTEAADWGDDPEYRDIARTFDSIAGLVDGRDDFILALEAFHLPHISGRTAALMRREHYTLLLDMMVWRKPIPEKHYTR
ncbi:hypothetical protein CBS147343_2906 [Aspergillus niger]|nr:hypothetical protein CBS11350_3680 [Aspergillus niger]KAI3083128.1 hypothetical protein CBS147343_2906 [Aspergillus niger]